MRIRADNYPVILIAAFVLGMLLAMALGFRPDYGSHRGEGPAAQATIAWPGGRGR